MYEILMQALVFIVKDAALARDPDPRWQKKAQQRVLADVSRRLGIIQPITLEQERMLEGVHQCMN